MSTKATFSGEPSDTGHGISHDRVSPFNLQPSGERQRGGERERGRGGEREKGRSSKRESERERERPGERESERERETI